MKQRQNGASSNVNCAIKIDLLSVLNPSLKNSSALSVLEIHDGISAVGDHLRP